MSWRVTKSDQAAQKLAGYDNQGYYSAEKMEIVNMTSSQ